MSRWKPTADEKRAIRAFAAASEGRPPRALHIEIGERIGEGGNFDTSFNILILTRGDTTRDAFGTTDLNQPLPWSFLDDGIELTEDGKALVDFYVYEKLFDDHGDLLTNVQAHVETVEGNPRLVKISGTGALDATGDVLHAFHVPPKNRQPGTEAHEDYQRWVKQQRDWEREKRTRFSAKR